MNQNMLESIIDFNSDFKFVFVLTLFPRLFKFIKTPNNLKIIFKFDNLELYSSSVLSYSNLILLSKWYKLLKAISSSSKSLFDFMKSIKYKISLNFSSFSKTSKNPFHV